MAKFIFGLVCGAVLVYYAEHRSPEKEAQFKTEVTRRAPMITKLGTQ